MASSTRGVRIWLYITTLTILLMIGVGGLTRLTRSGLSIVEWKPIAGVLPPLNDEQWNIEFEKYKQFPEYQTVNGHYELHDFKFIYLWEYSHRLLGRLIGLIFAIPLFYFAVRGRVRGGLARKLVGALILGGLQGFIGWFMVKSGLVDQPRVSHYRLATHLGLAMFLMVFLYWIARDVRYPVRKVFGGERRLFTWTLAFLSLLCLQIFYGALTAGLHAGHMYNTFPLWNGLVIPPGMGSMARDIFDNPVTVQFIHRGLGWTIFFAALALAYFGTKLRYVTAKQILALRIVGGVAILQFILGIFTLLHAVPVALGSAHQIGASLLLLATVHALHVSREGSPQFSVMQN
ncbi:MAG: heme A synthase [Proteobacteria bacterium]|nr:MAG: heme A synthase [Pseudomonadota bacterium]